MPLPAREAEVKPHNTTLINLREGWLEAMANLLHDHMRKCSVPTADGCRVSCGFPLSRRGHPAEYIEGQCFAPKHSRDGRPQIFINPMIDDSIEVVGILLHELIHAGVGCAFGHGLVFSQSARRVGLLKPWVDTGISDALRPILESYVWMLGPYPHAALANIPARSKRAKGSYREAAERRQGTRLRLFECNCVPVIKARVAHDDFPATCEICHGRFHRVP